MSRALLAALAAVALVAVAGCGSKPKPASSGKADARKSDPAAAPAADASVTPSAPKAPEWSYSSVGKRDPFRSFLADFEKETGSLATRCATPLGRFELEQLRLVAVVTGLEDPVAMVEAPSGVGYSVHRGACIGKNGGTVTAVRTGELVVSEWATRADGSRDRTQTILRLPREAALMLEE